MEPIVEKITLVEDARFDSPKSMFLGRVMGNYLIYWWEHVALPLYSVINTFIIFSMNFVDVVVSVCSFRGRWHWLWHSETQRSRLHRLHIRGEIQRLRPLKSPLPSKWNGPSGYDTRVRLGVQLWRFPSCPWLCTVGGRPVVYQHRWVYDPWCISAERENYAGFIHLYVCLSFSEYFYIHDDLGLFWITGKMKYSSLL